MRRMVQRRIFFGGVVLALSAAALGHGQAKKAGSAGGTGSVAGSVSCADTNAPARFAVVTLERVPEEVSESAKKEKDEPGMNATATTDSIPGAELIGRAGETEVCRVETNNPIPA